jgi:MinD-like ATPase involved in chromosome partitioning or flagellar assembly
MPAKVIVVMSPKGGVGKTTMSVNLAAAISELNKKTLLIDANLETPHVAVYYGFVGFKYSLDDVLNERTRIENAIYTGDNPNFHLLPSRVSKGGENKTLHKLININSYIEKLKENYEFIIIDSKPSYELSFIKLIKDANSLIISNPDITSMIEAKKLKEELESANINVIGLVINKVNSRIKDQMTEKETRDLMDIKNVWKVREDNKVYNALKIGIPLVLSSSGSFAAKDIINVAKQLIKI